MTHLLYIYDFTKFRGGTFIDQEIFVVKKFHPQPTRKKLNPAKSFLRRSDVKFTSCFNSVDELSEEN